MYALALMFWELYGKCIIDESDHQRGGSPAYVIDFGNLSGFQVGTSQLEWILRVGVK